MQAVREKLKAEIKKGKTTIADVVRRTGLSRATLDRYVRALTVPNPVTNKVIADFLIVLDPAWKPPEPVNEDDAALAAMVRRIAAVRGLDPRDLLEKIEGLPPDNPQPQRPPKSLSRQRSKAGAKRASRPRQRKA